MRDSSHNRRSHAHHISKPCNMIISHRHGMLASIYSINVGPSGWENHLDLWTRPQRQRGHKIFFQKMVEGTTWWTAWFSLLHQAGTCMCSAKLGQRSCTLMAKRLHLIFEEKLQWFDEFQFHILGKPSNIVMALDGVGMGSSTSRRRTRFNNIWIQSTLNQEDWFLPRCFL